MFKVIKQSLVDWQVLKNGEPFAWITNNKGARMYTVSFRNINGEYAGFRNLTEAKKFATTQLSKNPTITPACTPAW